MKIRTIERKNYRPLFASEDITMLVAYIDVEGETLGLSHRDDDPEGVWAADSRIGPDGQPYFVHGEGDRTVSKRTAGPDLAALLDAAALEV